MASVTKIGIRSKFFSTRGSAPILLAWVLALTLAGCAGSEKHDEALAAKRALEFAKVVLIEKDFVKGHEMLAEGGKRHIPVEKLKQTVASIFNNLFFKGP